MWWHFISFEGRIHSIVGLPDGAGGKNLPANAEDSGDRDSIPGSGWEDPLEEEMATHSSTLAWRIPWPEEPGGLQRSWT